jgi:hypothetical protein
MQNSGFGRHNSEIRRLKAQGETGYFVSRVIFAVICVLCCGAAGTPTQEEVFRSFQENMVEKTDGTRVIAVVFLAAATVVVLLLVANRHKRQVTPKVLNHPGKLLKEVGKGVALKGSEVKRLKVLAEQCQCSSPLTLLLCPSLLERAMKGKRGEGASR